MSKTTYSLAVLTCAQVFICAPLLAEHQKTDLMIPMCDGLKLHTEVWRDPAQTGDLPFLITRSPYGWARAKNMLTGSYSDLAKDGYIFVFQDIRGRYQSEGTFVMQRPVCEPKATKCIDEGTDTWDTIDYLQERARKQRARGDPRHFLSEDG